MKHEMRAGLSSIVGSRVSRAEPVHDYVQIAFGDDANLSIFNPFKSNAKLEALVGLTVTDVIETDDEIVISLDQLDVRIDMRSEAYRGPEALVFNRSGLPPIVWN